MHLPFTLLLQTLPITMAKFPVQAGFDPSSKRWSRVLDGPRYFLDSLQNAVMLMHQQTVFDGAARGPAQGAAIVCGVSGTCEVRDNKTGKEGEVERSRE